MVSCLGTTAFVAAVAFDACIGADPKRVGCFSFGWSMVAIRTVKQWLREVRLSHRLNSVSRFVTLTGVS